LKLQTSIWGKNKNIFKSVLNFLSFGFSSKNMKRTIIFPFVFYGCEKWPLKLTAERRLRVFDDSVRRRIFGHRWEEITGEWRKLPSEGLIHLYFSPHILRGITSSLFKWAVPVAEMWREEVRIGFWWGNLREELKEIGVDSRIILRWIFWNWDAGHGWIDLVEDKDRLRSLVNAVMNLRFP